MALGSGFCELGHVHAFSNNYKVSRTGTIIDVAQVSSKSDFHSVNYFLPGNRLDHQYLPNVIVIVEGKTDKAFLEMAVRNRFTD